MKLEPADGYLSIRIPGKLLKEFDKKINALRLQLPPHARRQINRSQIVLEMIQHFIKSDN